MPDKRKAALEALDELFLIALGEGSEAQSIFTRELKDIIKAALSSPQWGDIGTALVVSTSRDEPLRIYPYKDGDATSLNHAVGGAMFFDGADKHNNEVAGITGDLLHDGQVSLEDAELTLRSVVIIPPVPKGFEG